ncbi:MAG TPA: ABC transporter ATP-binding protein [Candidatus Paceibacterota bacterium]
MEKLNNIDLYKQIIGFAKPFKKPFIWVFTCIAIANAASALAAWCFSKIFNIIQEHRTDKEYLYVSLGLTVVSGVFFLIRILVTTKQGKIEVKYLDYLIQNYLNHASVAKFFSFSGGQHLNEHSGVKQSIVNNGVSSLKSQIEELIYDLTPNALRFLMALFLLMYANLLVGLLFIIVSVIFGLMMHRYNLKLVPGIRKLRDYNIVRSRFTSELFRFVGLVKSESQEKRSLTELNGVQSTGQEIYAETWNPAIDRMRVIRFIVTSLRYGLIALGVYLFFDNKLGAGDLFLIFTWSTTFIDSLWEFTDFHKRFLLDKINIEKYFQILNVKPDILIVENPIKIPNLKGVIEFKDVTFGYPRRKDSHESIENDEEPFQNVLHKISFKIYPGEKIGIVGESGSGKSTLGSLILRSFDPQEGQIFIDGNDLRLLDLGLYLKQVGVVPQQVDLLDRSIKDNILFGLNEGAEILSDEQLKEIAEMAGINGFFSRLEHGFDTLAGERGIKLSGGERQRIGIARALAKNPQIMIFDEATSALDTVNEKIVQDAINRACKDKTALIIAHRLSTVKSCDKIMVFRAGYLVDIGSHEDLLKRCDYYSELVAHQIEQVTFSLN